MMTSRTKPLAGRAPRRSTDRERGDYLKGYRRAFPYPPSVEACAKWAGVIPGTWYLWERDGLAFDKYKEARRAIDLAALQIVNETMALLSERLRDFYSVEIPNQRELF